jgi:hypothetical protein
VMFKTEQKRLKDLKNRDITEAAEKFWVWISISIHRLAGLYVIMSLYIA